LQFAMSLTNFHRPRDRRRGAASASRNSYKLRPEVPSVKYRAALRPGRNYYSPAQRNAHPPLSAEGAGRGSLRGIYISDRRSRCRSTDHLRNVFQKRDTYPAFRIARQLQFRADCCRSMSLVRSSTARQPDARAASVPWTRIKRRHGRYGITSVGRVAV
jgi:hypothetical protein